MDPNSATKKHQYCNLNEKHHLKNAKKLKNIIMGTKNTNKVA